MAGKKLTMEQALSLVETGVMTRDDLQTLANQDRLQVFRYNLRNADEKPEIVHTVHAALVSIIEENAFDLFMAGYRPAIMWKGVKEADEDEG